MAMTPPNVPPTKPFNFFKSIQTQATQHTQTLPHLPPHTTPPTDTTKKTNTTISRPQQIERMRSETSSRNYAHSPLYFSNSPANTPSTDSHTPNSASPPRVISQTMLDKVPTSDKSDYFFFDGTPPPNREISNSLGWVRSAHTSPSINLRAHRPTGSPLKRPQTPPTSFMSPQRNIGRTQSPPPFNPLSASLPQLPVTPKNNKPHKFFDDMKSDNPSKESKQIQQVSEDENIIDHLLPTSHFSSDIGLDDFVEVGSAPSTGGGGGNPGVPPSIQVSKSDGELPLLMGIKSNYFFYD
jgi:hypothetical protein